MPENWSTALTAVTTAMTNMTTTITGSPILLLSVAIPFVGAVIGLTKRLFRFRSR